MRMIKQNVRLLLASLFSLGSLILMSGPVAAQTTVRTIPAHASVLSAIPAIDSTISQAPTTVTVFTAENINPDPKVSNLFVYGPAGEATSKLISQGNATVSLSNPKEMSITIKPDPQHTTGVYVVHWITKSALDGDPDEGAFTFTVSAAAPTATPAVTATSTTGQATTPTASNTSIGGATPIWVTAVLALVALLIGLGGGFVLGRRRPAPSSGSLGAMRRTIEEEQQESTKHP
jgi:methionine-rich copper-binding protein CopC